jgi:uncharacterized protein (DUF2336 family)
VPNDRHTDVDALLARAADRAREARAEREHAIVDLFIPVDQRLTDQQRALMKDVLGRLLCSVEMEVRQHLADALQRSPVELPDLEKLLANETVELARPVLESSSVVRDSDLMEIVMQCAEEYRMAVALRETHGAPLAEALVQKGLQSGEEDVLEAFIRSSDSVLSRRAMELLVAENKRNGEFQQPLLSANDLPVPLAQQVHWWVSAAIRAHILRDFVLEQTVLDPMLERAVRRAMVDHDETQSAPSRALRLARRLDELGELTDSFFLRTLRQGRLCLCAAGLSLRARTDFATAWRILTDHGHERFVVLAKAIELGRDAAASMVLALDGAGNASGARPPARRAEVLRLYDEIEPSAAHRLLGYWQLDGDFRSAVEVLTEVPA